MHCTAPLFCDFPISVGQPWDSRGEHHGSCGAVPPPARYLGSHVERDGSAGGGRPPDELSGWRKPSLAPCPVPALLPGALRRPQPGIVALTGGMETCR